VFYNGTNKFLVLLTVEALKKLLESGEVMFLEDMMAFFPQNTTSENFVLHTPPKREKIPGLERSILWLEGSKEV